MPLKVAVTDHSKKHGVVAARFEKSAKKILKTLGWKHAEISVLLTSDKEIRKINRKFLKHDYATDVIAFGTEDPVQIGDIVISLDTAAANGKEYGNTFSYEVLFYFTHGLLHLMGHDDSTEKKSKSMHRKQDLVLRKTKLNRFSLVR